MDAGPSQAWALRSVGAILARVTYCIHADASFSRLQKRPIVSGALGVRVRARGCACARACSGVRAGVFLPALASRAPALRRALVPPPAACRPRRGRFRSRFSAGGVGAWLPFSSLQAGGGGLGSHRYAGAAPGASSRPAPPVCASAAAVGAHGPAPSLGPCRACLVPFITTLTNPSRA